MDGNDLLAVYDATRRARERAAEGEGPTLVECVTYRLEGHSPSDDPRAYRPAELVEPWRKKDPILRLKAFLVMGCVGCIHSMGRCRRAVSRCIGHEIKYPDFFRFVDTAHMRRLPCSNAFIWSSSAKSSDSAR